MTTVAKLAPFRELDLVERQMRRMFDFLPAVPAADVYETPEDFVVELEVPGFAEKDLSLEVNDHVLTVRGEAAAAREEKEKTYLLHERSERMFERRFRLPETAATEKLAATFDRGVLEIHAPKSVEAKPRKIKIGTGA